MRKYGLIGFPLGHSFSKQYFTEKFHKEEITGCTYNNYPLSSLTQLPELILKEPDLCGLNVTIPYKSEIFRFLDYIEPEAQEIGAVNVIKIQRSGQQIKLSGYNSDVTGIRETLMPFFERGIRNALVLGTGGSSKAVCYVLQKSGMNVSRVSRTARPGILAYSDITPVLLQNTDLIINTTPLGMFPEIANKPDIDYDLLTEKHILFDLVYNPEITSFLRMGMERGCPVTGGLKMLHSQAEKAWEIWNNETL